MDREEAGRLGALHAYGDLGQANDPDFDAIVRLAASEFGAPVALISLVDEHRQWFKAKVGIDATETARSISFCTHAIRGPDVFVVEDATQDERFADNPMVTGGPKFRFYAGAPLRSAEGKLIGTLCVLDFRARATPTATEKAQLAQLADRTVAVFERIRRRSR